MDTSPVPYRVDRTIGRMYVPDGLLLLYAGEPWDYRVHIATTEAMARIRKEHPNVAVVGLPAAVTPAAP